MKHRYYPILLLYFFQAACMPEEDLPIRHTGETPEYFIECYCQPGRPFALSATSVLPVSEDLQIDFSKEMKVTIHADKAISLIHALYTLPGSDSLFLDITTIDHKSITASTSIPPAVSIYNCQVAGNEAIIRFYISEKADENYYIYTAEAVHADSILNKEVCYLDYSEFQQEGLTEKSVILPDIGQAEEIIFTLKRITKANYDYQVSLNAANTANQSSITTPVPLKGNLQGALGIFTCYTEDKQTVPL